MGDWSLPLPPVGGLLSRRDVVNAEMQDDGVMCVTVRVGLESRFVRYATLPPGRSWFRPRERHHETWARRAAEKEPSTWLWYPSEDEAMRAIALMLRDGFPQDARLTHIKDRVAIEAELLDL